VAGISTDTLDAQKAFADKVGGLRFPLLSDPDAAVTKAYETYKDEWKVSDRATVVIGEDGTVLLSYPEAPRDGKGHAQAVFADLAELM
jgi:peroxiredoxin